MVTGDSCQCMKRTKQSTAGDITVRHTTCTVTGCGFVTKYQNTSNLENHYVTAGTDHKEFVDRLTSIQHIDRQERLGSASDGRITLSHTFVSPAFIADKKSRRDIKFVKWLVRKNRALPMSKKDDELNDFVDEVTDGVYCTNWKTAGKQHDDLKKNTMDKTLENTLKTGMNTKFPTRHDKAVFTDDKGTYRKRK
jgi:hypothetical protein